jgi:hypothetical protein
MIVGENTGKQATVEPGSFWLMAWRHRNTSMAIRFYLERLLWPMFQIRVKHKL